MIYCSLYNDLNILFSADFASIQRRLERKLGECKAAQGELRVLMREKRELEEQNLRLSHRVAYLEDHCSSLARAMRSVAVSVESCLRPPGPPPPPPQVRPGSSSASSGVFSLSDSLGEESSGR